MHPPIILIHGSWHSGLHWKPLAQLLEQKGHKVLCLDLPGHGNNHKPASLVTYADYYDCLKKAVEAASEPVILVAHSMAGIISAPLLEEMADNIKHLFLIAAYVPDDGKSLLDVALRYTGSLIPQIVENDFAAGVCRIKKEGAKEILYNGCSEEVQTWALSKLQDQPIQPVIAPINCHYSPELAHKRTYIITEEDLDVDPQAQKDMSQSCPSRVISIKTGHFPFLSHPELLAEILLQKI